MSRLEVYDEYAVVVRPDPRPTPAAIALDALGVILQGVLFASLFALAWGGFSLAITLLLQEAKS